MRAKVRLYLPVILLTILLLALLTAGDCNETTTDPNKENEYFDPEYQLSVTLAWPTTINILQGESRSFVFGISRLYGHNAALTFEATGLPTGVTATFDPQPATTQHTTCTITLQAATDADIVTETFRIDGVTEKAVMEISKGIRVLPLNGFRLEPSSSPIDINRGGSDYVTINIIRGATFADPVSLSEAIISGSGINPGITFDFDPPAPAGDSSVLRLEVGMQATSAYYNFEITGTAGSLDCTYRVFRINVLPPIGWHTVNSPTNRKLNDVQLSGADAMWCAGELGTIIRTLNHGVQWTLFDNHIYTSNLHGIFLTDFNSVTVVGDFGTILNTEDNGQSWQFQGGVPGTIRAVQFLDDSIGYAVGDFDKFARTKNGGTTWNTSNPGSSSDFWAVCFHDEQDGVLAGSFDGIYVTGDSGATWTQIPSYNVSYSDMCFVDENVGYVVGGQVPEAPFNGDAVILKTTDGGYTWTPQTSGTTEGLLGVSFKDANHGVTVGTNGTILVTINGGITWHEEDSGTNNILMAVSWTEDRRPVAVGYGGIIVRRDVP